MPHFTTPEPVSVRVEVALGNVRVVASDRHDSVVTVTAAHAQRRADVEAAAQAEVSFDHGTLVVRGPVPRGVGKLIGPTRRSGTIDVLVEVPEGSHVRSEAALGDFRSDGRLGDVHVKVAVGHLRVEDAVRVQLSSGTGSLVLGRAAGQAKLRSAGDIDVSHVGAHADVKNLNGATKIAEARGPLRIRSANGDITIGRVSAEVDAKTANGSITIDEVGHGAVALQTASGGLDIGIRRGTAAFVDARSQYGRVTNGLEAADGPDVPGETVPIRARTAYGDIVLRRPRTAEETS